MYRRLLGGALAVLTAAVLCGCQAIVKVGIVTTSAGRGRVTVAVSLDRSAGAAVGDLAKELDTSGLRRQGWAVTAPHLGPAGSTVVAASHPFATLAEANADLSEIAGATPATSVFGGLRLVRQRNFFATTIRLAGPVRLGCGLGCFGDPALDKVLGSSVGSAAATVARDNGIDIARAIRFQVSARLPGPISSTNASSRSGPTLHWQVPLGTTETLTATSKMTNVAHVVLAAVIAGVALVVLAFVVFRLLRRRHSRPAHRRRWRKAPVTEEAPIDDGGLKSADSGAAGRGGAGV